jgi:ornithine decarboxylase
MSEKFGVLPAEALGLVKEAVELELKFVGIAFHVGSQAENLAQWRTAIEEVKEVIVELMENDIRLEFLNIGGGYPESYRTAETPSLQDIAAEVRSVVAELPYELDLYVEPGRRLVANAATLTVSVIARLERNEENWLFLDAGAYSGVFEAMVFQGNMRFDIDSPPDRTGKTTLFVLTGPTCDSLDTISYNAELPDDIQEGDKLVIKNVGAYSLCFATEFNGFEIPKAYFD